MSTTWTAVTVTASAELADSMANFLIEQGAPGLQTEEHGSAVAVTAHFDGPAPIEALERYCEALSELFPGTGRPEIRLAPVSDDAWAESWRAHFPPLPIGDRLFVHPPWIDTVPEGRVSVVIDPGMAFGTGHHSSTRGCLRLLEDALRTYCGARVLDIGTGSGILSIAAAKLGAAEIWAIDTDADACRVAEANATVNQVRGTIRVTARLDDTSGAFDVVLANLFANQLIELAPDIVTRLRHSGTAIGSGILVEEADAVRDRWSAAGLHEDTAYEEDGWITLAFRHGRGS